jgi:RNA polymerase sigma-70 factor (ECF subfamily)
VESRTDTELMIAVCNGEVSLLADLFDRHHVRLFNFFLRLTDRRETSEDLVQEAFLRMLKYRKTYRAKASFPVWMYRIARNVLADHWGRATRDEPLERAETVADPRISQFEAARLDEEIATLRAAMLSLPADRRELLVLVRFEGLRHDEIAALLDCSAGAVRVRAHRALAELRDAYVALTGGQHDLRRAERTAD